MFCRNCGTRLNDGTELCTSCENKIKSAGISEPMTENTPYVHQPKSENAKKGMVWHFILTYPIILSVSAVFAVFAFKSVYGVAINGAYAFLNGCGLEESIETGVGMAKYNYGDDVYFGIIDISARIFSGFISVFGIVTAVSLSDRKKQSLKLLTLFTVMIGVFNVLYAIYRYIDVGIVNLFNPSARNFETNFAVNFQFTVYAVLALLLFIINRKYYSKRKYLFD